MRTTRLNERDLTRIVRQVLREEDTAADMGNNNKCFNNRTISIPQSCRVKPRKNNLIGTGLKVEKDCLRDLGGMMNMKNLTEVTKLMACLIKQSETPLRY
jgi:hypothetical protein